MHRLIATTFKILACSMLFMFLLDTSLLMIEIISIHSRVSNITSIMQTEVARNNCMPEAMAEGFENYLEEIVDNSTISSPDDITTNFRQDLTINGNTYDALTPENAGEYGDFVTLAVNVRLHPSYVYYNENRDASNQSWLNRCPFINYYLKYIYSVACLRYLK